MGGVKYISTPFPKDVETLKKHREDLKLVSFLTGLISHHASIEDQFLTDTELPSFSATFSQLSRISSEPRELVEVMDNSNNVANIQPSSTSYRGRGRG